MPTSGTKIARIASLDVARALALIAMAIFHTGWDLAYLGLAQIDPAGDVVWVIFARVVASSFLFIAGMSLALATRQGFNHQAFLRRLAVIALAAGGVSLGTWWFIADNFVVFGILHHLAVASVLLLPFLFVPLWGAVAAAAIALVLPTLIVLPGSGYGVGYVLGFTSAIPDSVDYVALFPWLAADLAGLTAGRALWRYAPNGQWALWPGDTIPFRWLALAGRHSLVIYLVHQPIILGCLMLVAFVLNSPPEAALSPAGERFQQSCSRVCLSYGRSAELCARACQCTEQALRQENLWQKTLQDQLSASQTERLRVLAQSCQSTP